MQHLDEGTIHAWLDDAVDTSERERIERHIAECAECSAAVAEARGLIAGATRIVSALDVVRGNVIPKQPARGARPSLWRSLRFSPARAAIAATVLVAAGTVFTLRRGELEVPREETPSSRVAPSPSVSPVVAPQRQDTRPSSAARRAVADAPAARDAAAERSREPASSGLAANADKAASGPPASPAPKTTAAPEPRASLAKDSGGRLDSIAAQPSRPAAFAQSAGARAAGNIADVRQLREVVATGASSRVDDVTGCYEMATDSSASTADSPAFPRRFALQHTQGDGAQNVVRRVTADGRIDSVLTGGRWERVSPNAANVYWSQLAGAPVQTLSLRFTSAGVAGQSITPTGTKPVSVARAVCRP